MKWRFISFAVVFVMVAAWIMAIPAQIAEAQSGNIWQVQYYSNPFLSGQPAQTSSTYYISFNWGDAPPAPNMPADNWSARFTTGAYFRGGLYRFVITADDGFTLRVNNQVIGSTIEAPQPGKTFTFDVSMKAGTSSLQVDYRDHASAAYLYVNWGLVGSPITGANTPTVRPPRPTPVGQLITRYGDYTTCAKRRVHQVNCFKSDGYWNSPNSGSIITEPLILIWYACEPGLIVSQPLTFGGALQTTQCSKTGAGYFIKP